MYRIFRMNLTPQLIFPELHGQNVYYLLVIFLLFYFITLLLFYFLLIGAQPHKRVTQGAAPSNKLIGRSPIKVTIY